MKFLIFNELDPEAKRSKVRYFPAKTLLKVQPQVHKAHFYKTCILSRNAIAGYEQQHN